MGKKLVVIFRMLIGYLIGWIGWFAFLFFLTQKPGSLGVGLVSSYAIFFIGALINHKYYRPSLNSFGGVLFFMFIYAPLYFLLGFIFLIKGAVRYRREADDEYESESRSSKGRRARGERTNNRTSKESDGEPKQKRKIKGLGWTILRVVIGGLFAAIGFTFCVWTILGEENGLCYVFGVGILIIAVSITTWRAPRSILSGRTTNWWWYTFDWIFSILTYPFCALVFLILHYIEIGQTISRGGSLSGGGGGYKGNDESMKLLSKRIAEFCNGCRVKVSNSYISGEIDYVRHALTDHHVEIFVGVNVEPKTLYSQADEEHAYKDMEDYQRQVVLRIAGLQREILAAVQELVNAGHSTLEGNWNVDPKLTINGRQIRLR